MQPIKKIDQAAAAFVPYAEKINELVDGFNLLLSLEAGPGLKITKSDNKIIIEIGTLTVDLDCKEGGGATGTITGS